MNYKVIGAFSGFYLLMDIISILPPYYFDGYMTSVFLRNIFMLFLVYFAIILSEKMDNMEKVLLISSIGIIAVIFTTLRSGKVMSYYIGETTYYIKLAAELTIFDFVITIFIVLVIAISLYLVFISTVAGVTATALIPPLLYIAPYLAFWDLIKNVSVIGIFLIIPPLLLYLSAKAALKKVKGVPSQVPEMPPTAPTQEIPSETTESVSSEPTDLTPLEKKFLDFIERKGGEYSREEAAKELSLTIDEVIRIEKSLESKGYIEFE